MDTSNDEELIRPNPEGKGQASASQEEGKTSRADKGKMDTSNDEELIRPNSEGKGQASASQEEGKTSRADKGKMDTSNDEELIRPNSEGKGQASASQEEGKTSRADKGKMDTSNDEELIRPNSEGKGQASASQEEGKTSRADKGKMDTSNDEELIRPNSEGKGQASASQEEGKTSRADKGKMDTSNDEELIRPNSEGKGQASASQEEGKTSRADKGKMDTSNDEELIRPNSEGKGQASASQEEGKTSRVELDYDVIGLCLGRSSVKKLLTLKVMSKTSKSVIESSHFAKNHLECHRKIGEAELLLEVLHETDINDIASLETLKVDLCSSSSSTVELPTPWYYRGCSVSPTSCDGLILVYDLERSSFLFNPATLWFRALPPSNYQILTSSLKCEGHPDIRCFAPCFGKDIVDNMYKAVLLYNSSEQEMEKVATCEVFEVTTCEVFDFAKNAWRKVCPAATYKIFNSNPAYVEGKANWMVDWTGMDVTKVVRFDFHGETFDVIDAPFTASHENNVVLCNVKSSLCASVLNGSDNSIWFFHEHEKKWEKVYTIDLDDLWFGCVHSVEDYAISPLGIVNEELLFLDKKNFFMQMQVRSYDGVCVKSVFETDLIITAVPFSPSMMFCEYEEREIADEFESTVATSRHYEYAIQKK